MSQVRQAAGNGLQVGRWTKQSTLLTLLNLFRIKWYAVAVTTTPILLVLLPHHFLRWYSNNRLFFTVWFFAAEIYQLFFVVGLL